MVIESLSTAKKLCKVNNIFNKEDIGYKMNTTGIYYKNYFVKAVDNFHPGVSCNFSWKNRHRSIFLLC